MVPSLAAEAYSAAVHKLPGWLRAPHLNAPMVQRLALRQIGASTAARSQRALLPPAAYAGKVQHQRSVRGHSAAVYCVTFDRVGARLITGSDDTFIKVRWEVYDASGLYYIPFLSGTFYTASRGWLLKRPCSYCAPLFSSMAIHTLQALRLLLPNIPSMQLDDNSGINCTQIWSTETALLLCTCRGHRAEVTDLAVNVDNTLFASSSNDHTVRCWSLKVSTSLVCQHSTIVVSSGYSISKMP